MMPCKWAILPALPPHAKHYYFMRKDIAIRRKICEIAIAAAQSRRAFSTTFQSYIMYGRKPDLLYWRRHEMLHLRRVASGLLLLATAHCFQDARQVTSAGRTASWRTAAGHDCQMRN